MCCALNTLISYTLKTHQYSSMYKHDSKSCVDSQFVPNKQAEGTVARKISLRRHEEESLRGTTP